MAIAGGGEEKLYRRRDGEKKQECPTQTTSIPVHGESDKMTREGGGNSRALSMSLRPSPVKVVVPLGKVTWSLTQREKEALKNPNGSTLKRCKIPKRGPEGRG